MKSLLTVDELAAELRICERTARQLISERALPILRVGRCVRIRRSDLDAFLATKGWRVPISDEDSPSDEVPGGLGERP